MSPYVVSSALIRKEKKVQKLVYYTSRALRKVEGRYPMIEKLAFTLITTSRKLRHYFQAYVINIMRDHPLKKAMNKLEAAGRLIQWAIELSEFDIKYQPRNAIKAQVLVDFIVEFTPLPLQWPPTTSTATTTTSTTTTSTNPHLTTPP